MAYLEYRPTQTLFQYTSLDGLFGILKSKRLRFSDLASANDPRELKLGYERVMQALDSVARIEYRGKKGELLSHLIERLRGYYRSSHVFCCCFSLAMDELPMWGAYAANYRGVAIGFRPAAFLATPGRIQKVRYLDPTKDGDFRALALDIAAQVDAYASSKEVEHWLSAAVDAITTITALKHTSWAYEREIRMIYIQRNERPQDEFTSRFPVADLPSGEFIYWREPYERTANDRTVKYFEFPFGRMRDGKFDHRRAIQSIVIGPNCPLSESEVSAALSDQGFEGFTVRRSECQIR